MQDALSNVKEAILSDPCLKLFDHHCLIVLRTDFSSHGFGYVVCQPGDDKASSLEMDAYQCGSDFSFMEKSSTAVLHLVAFGARRCHGHEICSHSHLSKGFAGDWWISKYCHMLFGQQFVWATDCYAIKFILSFDGTNPAILHLQMRLMCWDVNIDHQNNNYLVDADYWSHLGNDLCFDPLFKKYLELTRSLRLLHPVPTSLPMLPKNMPYYRGPRIIPTQSSTDPSNDTHCHQAIISTLLADNCHSLCHLFNIPVQFGEFEKAIPSLARPTNNDRFSSLAGLYTPFTEDILLQPFNLGTCHFMCG